MSPLSREDQKQDESALLLPHVVLLRFGEDRLQDLLVWQGKVAPHILALQAREIMTLRLSPEDEGGVILRWGGECARHKPRLLLIMVHTPLVGIRFLLNLRFSLTRLKAQSDMCTQIVSRRTEDQLSLNLSLLHLHRHQAQRKDLAPLHHREVRCLAIVSEEHSMVSKQ